MTFQISILTANKNYFEAFSIIKLSLLKSYFVATKALKCGFLSSGVRNWYLQARVSDSHANIESSLKQVIIVLLIGKKKTCNKPLKSKSMLHCNTVIKFTLMYIH